MDEAEDVSAAPDPLAVMRARWLLCLVLALIGALAGVLVASQHEVRTTAETRLALGTQTLQAYQVAGFAVASEALAADYARFVNNSSTTQSLVSRALRDHSGKVTAISASPVPDSDVIRVEATATTPAAARLASQAIARSLVKETATDRRAARAKLLDQHASLSLDVAKQQGIVSDLDKGKKLDQAQAKLATLRLQQSAVGVAYQQTLTVSQPQSSLRVIQPSAITGNDKTSTYELFAVMGLLGGLVIGLVIANLLGVRRRSAA